MAMPPPKPILLLLVASLAQIRPGSAQVVADFHEVCSNCAYEFRSERFYPATGAPDPKELEALEDCAAASQRETDGKDCKTHAEILHRNVSLCFLDVGRRVRLGLRPHEYDFDIIQQVPGSSAQRLLPGYINHYVLRVRNRATGATYILDNTMHKARRKTMGLLYSEIQRATPQATYEKYFRILSSAEGCVVGSIFPSSMLGATLIGLTAALEPATRTTKFRQLFEYANACRQQHTPAPPAPQGRGTPAGSRSGSR